MLNLYQDELKPTIKFHFVSIFSKATFIYLLFFACNYNSSMSISFSKLLISILCIVNAIFFFNSVFSISSSSFSAIRFLFDDWRCSSSISSIFVYESSYEFFTLCFIISSRFICCFSKSFLSTSFKSINSYSSLSFSSKTSLLFDSSKPIFASKIFPYCLRFTIFFSYWILIFLSSFLYFFFYISSVTFLPLILSCSSILYLSTFLLSLKISSRA